MIGRRQLLGIAAASLMLAACDASETAEAPVAESYPVPAEYGYTIDAVYDHDTGAFTQGLLFKDGFLFESTGRKGQSTVRRIDLESGEVLAKTDLPAEVFGEGMAERGDDFLVLTWRSGIGFVVDAETLAIEDTLEYYGEGWGLTSSGSDLYMSDGTSWIRVLDSEDLSETRRIRVTDGGVPVEEINELEWVEGEIFANVWHSNRIARIDPQTGYVVGWIDLTGLLDASEAGPDPEAVLNGIAYDDASDRLFVTGKLWPRIFEISLVPLGQ